MQNEILINHYMKYNSIILATLNINNKTIDVFDGENNQIFDYKAFFEYVAIFYNLIDDFIDKAKIIFEQFDYNRDIIEIKAEYKKINGKPVNFVYNLKNEGNGLYLLSLKEEKNSILGNLDQMTKANPKAYIDNRAKNNILTKTPFILINIDIDNFKHFNDLYGQTIGDMILIEMVSIVKNTLGDRGAISRIGGDRFLVLFEMSDDYDLVHEYLFELKQAMQKLSSKVDDSMVITVTIGCSRYPFDGSDYELLLKKSQKALVRGKNKGRDCFIIYLLDKCGEVSIDDKIDDIKKIENISAKNNLYSMITDVNKTLSDDKDFDESINKAISLVGSYLYVDRISIARVNIKTHKIMKHHAWFSPKITVRYDAYCVDEIVPIWAEALGSKNFIKVDDIKAYPDSYKLKSLFAVDHTTASLAFELVVNGRSYGIIRFDMTTGVRHWQSEDFQILMLISELLASHLQKNYLKETNYNTLYLDPKYGCNNFSKLFLDAGEYLLKSEASLFAVMELDIKNIISYRSIIGEKRMIEFVNGIVSKILLYKDILYGKKSDGAFIIFFKGNDKKIISNLYNDVSRYVEEFSLKYHFNRLIVTAGAYLANNDDRLVDAMNNANFARIYNKDDKLLFYSDEIIHEIESKNEMILRIDEAIANDEFLLYLQPKISTKTGKLIGAEALTRWNYKNEKILYPDEFINLFEEQGIIEKLDFRVFENTCRYQRRLLDMGKDIVPISVNVSRYVSDFEEYIKKLEEIRSRYNVDCKYIELEITEGMCYENTMYISAFIDVLHNLGYSVSLDDFGSGYSNLVSMTKIHFDTIKFDKSFCMDLSNSNVRIMLLKLIELIKTMNISTICEGVETKENVEYLASIGCDYIQGYYYSKPISSDDFEKKYFN